MPFIESLAEFQQRQACPFVETKLGWLFENGAASDGNRHDNPPADPVELRRRQIAYLKACLHRQESLLAQCREFITTQAEFHAAGFGGLPPEAAIEDANRFKANIERLQQQIHAKTEELRELLGPDPAAIRDRQRVERQAAANQILQRIA